MSISNLIAPVTTFIRRLTFALVVFFSTLVSADDKPNILFFAVDDLKDWHDNNHAVRTERWHYIRYSDGGEELYDMRADPPQWKNVARALDHAAEIEDLKRWLPKSNAPHFRDNGAGH